MAEIQEFLRAVLPSSGWFYVAAVIEKGCKHRGYRTDETDDAYRWAIDEWQRKGLNVYFTPCTWSQQYTTNADGKNKNCRKHPELSHRIRAFWLDIDSRKQGKDLQTALRELAAFCKESKLPFPNAVVSTGGGIHAYWTLEDELTLQQWQPLAEALKAACVIKGYAADHACTADAARILRLPGSKNLKYPERPEAKVLRLEPHTDLRAFTEALSFFRAAPTEDLNDEFSARGALNYVKPRMTLAVPRCPLLTAIYEDNGAQCDEPLWKGVLHLCAHAEDGEEWAHMLSSGHPDYNLITTDRKLGECDTSFPPTLCETLHSRFWQQPSPCEGCEHRGKIKTPLSLGRDKTEGSIQRPTGMPDGYFMTRSGIFLTSEDKDGKESVRRVAALPILDVLVYDVVDHSEGDALVRPHAQLTWLDGGGRQHTGVFQTNVLSDYRATYAALSAIKYPIHRADFRNGFDTLMTSWIQRLRDEGRVAVGKPQFGWHFKGADDEVVGFAIGKTMYKPDGTEEVMMWPETSLNHVYTVTGKLEEWRKAVALLKRRDRPELMTLVAGAFAAPLFTFLGESSAVVSAVSRESGVGKSSALKVAQAVWGNPKTGITSLDDTAKSVARKMGVIKNLPVLWDELRLTDENAAEFLQMMFQLSQGRERTRLTANADFREAGTWETILICASNNSLAEIAYGTGQRSNANLKRLFEYEIKFDGEAPSAGEGSEVFNALRYNHGHAGVLYVKFLVQNVKRVKREILALRSALFKMTGARHDDRFWIGTIACLLLGASYARELGLVDFDLAGLRGFLLKSYQGMQAIEEEVIEMDLCQRLLLDFTREYGGSGIVFRNPKPHHPTQRGDVDILRTPTDNRFGVTWEYYAGSGSLRVVRGPLVDFLRKRKVSRKEFLTEIERNGYLPRESRVFMAPGTRFASLGQTYVFEFTLPSTERSWLIPPNATTEGGDSLSDDAT